MGALAYAQPFRSQEVVPRVRLENSASPAKHQIETMPGGVALLDFDNDGRLDLFFTNGAPQPGLKKQHPRYSNRLLRNVGAGKFEDVTGRAGVAGEGFAMGAAAADYDNDGFTDLLVTGVRFNTLYRNRGDGTFEDVSRRAGIRSTEWSVSAGFFDYDNDGDLDLFLVNYVKWDPLSEPYCGDKKAGYRTYCHPKEYQGLPNTLLRNNGDGTFTDVSAAAGIEQHIGKGMGIAFADFNADGRMDVFVTNDTTPNFLFRNEGEGRFREVGLAAGLAIPDDGRILSSMGAEFRDMDGDGKPDAFVTALANETFPLFRNLGNGLFQEITHRARLAAATIPYSGWGTGAFDFDRDGWKDLVVANGDVNDNTEMFSSRKSKQQNLYLRNRGDGTFEGLPFGEPAQWRGAAFGDLDGDNRVDVVMTRLGQTAVIFTNSAANSNHWLTVGLRGTKSNYDAIGAQVNVVLTDGRRLVDHVSPAGGYVSSNDKRLYFGLGTAGKVSKVEVRWPSGQIQIVESVAVDRYLELKEP